MVLVSITTLAIGRWSSAAKILYQYISGHDAFGIAAAFWLKSRSGFIDYGQLLLP